MGTLTDLLNDVMPECPGASTDIALHHLFRAADKFCADSRIDRRWLDAVTTVSRQADYPIEPPDGTAFARVMIVKFDGHSISPNAAERAGDIDDDAYAESPDCFAVSPDGATLSLLPPPVRAGTLKIQIAVRPIQSDPVLADWILRDWGDDIAAGAKGTLMLMNKVTWADPQHGALYSKQFANAINSARHEATRGMSRAVPHVRRETIMGR